MNWGKGIRQGADAWWSDGKCHICTVAYHWPHECPLYVNQREGGLNRIAFLACKGIGHTPTECWVMREWINWAVPFLRDEEIERADATDLKRNACFACLKYGHQLPGCKSNLRSEFAQFAARNKCIQRMSTAAVGDVSSRWTDLEVNSAGNIVQMHRRAFTKPRLKWFFTTFMKDHGAADDAAAESQRADERKEALRAAAAMKALVAITKINE
ncbi:hypothetical protein niasHS_008440 [Heterodera schachtii]|uniref:Uncharacterized protein n=1 Tax=Heterodera schachtii TaxID=97005 RepID=A0ABD2J3T3_HETSC